MAEAEDQADSPRPSGLDSFGCHSRHVLANLMRMTAHGAVPPSTMHMGSGKGLGKELAKTLSHAVDAWASLGDAGSRA